MAKKTEDYIVKGGIIFFFVFYAIGYAKLIEPIEEPTKMAEISAPEPQEPRPKSEKRQPKSLPADWPVDLGRYFYWIDIAPGLTTGQI